MNLNSMNRFILDIVYPNRCPCCNSFIPYDKYLCTNCIEKLKIPMEELCKYCGFSLKHCKCGSGIYYDLAFACYTYDGIAKDGVLSLKHSNNLNFAYYTGSILSQRIKESVIKYDLVIPVPMHIRKKLKRGYNQAEVIAKVISKSLNIPMDATALKVRYSKIVQHSLNKHERIINAQNIYYEGKSNLEGKYVILVDDIMTTGSTLNICSQILHSMGAKSVIVAIATSNQIKKSRGF